jgi:PAS domain S-box-containing protein
MSESSTAEYRLAGTRSLGLLGLLLTVTLCAVFGGEVLIMYLLERLLPPDASEWTYILLDAGMLSLLVVAVMLPFMLHMRNLHLRQARNSLRMQYTLDHHAIVSMTDVTGRITFANDRFCEISGYTRAELIGQNHRILKSGEHPEDLYREMWHTVAGGRIWHGDICNRAKDGRLYWVRATITPFLDEHGKPEEYVAIRTDITEQKLLEARSRQQEMRFRTILDNLGEGVYTLDAAGMVTYLNREGERLLGWSLADLRGKSLHESIHHHTSDGRPLPADQCPIRQAMDENRIYRSGEEQFFCKDGRRLPVKITGAPLIVEGTRLGSVAVFSDASEERQLQQHLRDAKNAAEEAARIKSDFLSTMSHEIRTPLNGVIGMTDLLLDTTLDGEQTEFARLIKTSADALMAIISDILDFSKIEAGRLELETTDFSLRQIVESTLDVLAGKAFEKDLLLASLIEPELPDHLLGDPTRIRQILLNFLSNAIKFTASGEVMVSVRAVPTTDAGTDRAWLRFSVSDTGIGLSKSEQSGLFLPFMQSDSSTTRKYGGTGLGLSICKRLAEAMGGRIGVDSQSGTGSIFWAELPLAVGEEKRAIPDPGALLQGHRVILGGSAAGTAAVWRRYLDAWRIDFRTAGSLAELRRHIDTGEPWDLVLLAHPLPDSGLVEAAQVLRTGAGQPALISCLPQPNREIRLALSGLGVHVVQGPLRQSGLLHALAAALEGSPARPARRAEDVDVIEVAEPTRGSGQRLLLAEDNPVNQRVAAHMIERLGYTVDVVADGAQAVAAAARGCYQLLLMDCQMPEMDGFAAAIAIRRAEVGQRRRLPIVALTANVLQGDRERCIAAGMDDYLTKPIDATQLAGVLVRHLAQRGSGGRPAPVASGIEALPNGAVIDFSRLHDIFGDDEDGIAELLDALGESLRALCANLQTMLDGGGGNARDLAHELRGLAQNVGAPQLVTLAAQLEMHAVRGELPAFHALAPRVITECQRLFQFIDGRMARQKA